MFSTRSTGRAAFLCLALLSLPLSLPAQPAIDQVINSGVKQFADMAHVDNSTAVRNFERMKADFERNCPLYKAAGETCPEPPKPPRLRLVDTATLAKLILDYHLQVFVRSVADLMTGEFDPGKAYVYTTYVPASKLDYAALQPLNPIGPALGGGLFAAAVGDVLPDRSEYRGSGNVLYRKFVVKAKDGTTRSFWVAVEGV